MAQYENQKAVEKVVKHMKSFKVLLEYQKESNLISENTYKDLISNANLLIKNWQ